MKPAKRRRVLQAKRKAREGVTGERGGDYKRNHFKDNRYYSDKQRPRPSTAEGLPRSVSEEENVGGPGGGGGSEYWLHWNTKAEHFSDQLLELYQVGENLMTLTDVTLCTCEGRFIQAHKLVLSLCSNFFRRLFVQASRSNNSNAVIVLGNVKLQHLRYLLQFIYTGEVDVPANDLQNFLKAGESLQIEGLSGYIKTFGDKRISLEQSEVYDPPPEDPSSPLSPESENVELPIYISKAVSLNSSERNPKKEILDDDEEDKGSNYSDDMSVGDDVELDEDGDDSSSKERKSRRLKWTQVESTEEELKLNWRKRGKKGTANGIREVDYFYCAHASIKKGFDNCGAKLKREVFMGKTTYFSNNTPHSNHRTLTHGLTDKQKEVINKLLDLGVQRPDDILRAMQLENEELPRKMQLVNYLKKNRRKENTDNPLLPKPKVSDERKRKRIHKSTGNPRGRPRKSGDTSKVSNGTVKESSNNSEKHNQANDTSAERNPALVQHHQPHSSHSSTHPSPHHHYVQHPLSGNPQYHGFPHGQPGMATSGGGGGSGAMMDYHNFINNTMF